jgi:hypothetical protein
MFIITYYLTSLLDWSGQGVLDTTLLIMNIKGESQITVKMEIEAIIFCGLKKSKRQY